MLIFKNGTLNYRNDNKNSNTKLRRRHERFRQHARIRAARLKRPVGLIIYRIQHEYQSKPKENHLQLEQQSLDN